MEKIRLAILASAAGTTSEPIFNKAVVIVTNNPDAGIIEKAEKHGIPLAVRTRKDYQEDGKYSARLYGEELIRIFEEHNVDFISLNGWAFLLPENVVVAYPNHIANVHPGPLDPGHHDFGGKGMYWLSLHQAVLNFARNIKRPFNTAVTIIKVAKNYDEGGILAYTEVLVLPDDTAEVLQERVKVSERQQNIDFWNRVEEFGKLPPVIQRPSRLILPEEVEILDKAKAEAIAAYPHG